MSDTSISDASAEIRKFISKVWWIALLRGVLMVLLGIYALLNPELTLIVFTKILGAFILIDGVFSIIAAVAGWSESRVWSLARGILSILVGIFIYAHPAVIGAIAAATLIILMSVQIVAGGVMEIIVAIQKRKAIEGEGWLIFDGLILILLGFLLFLTPFFWGMVLVRVFGVFAILIGIIAIVLSLRIRKLGQMAMPDAD
ncbi:DUF308 domain-containing protein [Rubinisphaera sp.]|uniref:HdeD family acid-resistance protein n=1 Tax=Rubinisphaera sp. TaxID=2024857 RepID=UPI000C0ECA9A|nr:DUF308 domain-containing protein [Rubinisphaera sp.]MBV12382.1 hypothetical protein [Rubinisphaera sp.]HCS50554.1 hypothetical protein [Planctomycetaceae bacterium]|tara:strand:- start:1339 stop:1938 length:600 start_codon:yes stop_codon:yes gene_type:complete